MNNVIIWVTDKVGPIMKNINSYLIIRVSDVGKVLYSCFPLVSANRNLASLIHAGILKYNFATLFFIIEVSPLFKKLSTSNGMYLHAHGLLSGLVSRKRGTYIFRRFQRDSRCMCACTPNFHQQALLQRMDLDFKFIH